MTRILLRARPLIYFLILAILSLSLPHRPAEAHLVGTESAITLDRDAAADRARIHTFLDRPDVQAQLNSYGISVEETRARAQEQAAEALVDGWLRTGDVGTIDPEGYMDITDRTKDLVKSGGEWISSVALESALMGHPKVLEAAVIAIPHDKWQERPLAIVVPKPDQAESITKDELIEFLRPKFAKFWLPDGVEFIKEMPKTSVGKFDKKVLREQFKQHRLNA